VYREPAPDPHAMIGWHVAHHWAAGDGALPPSPTGQRCQNGVDV